jgi:hypothetical protein
VAKKRTSRKAAGKSKTRRSATPPRRGDRSRLDLKPLQDHIRKRIKDLESAAPEMAGARQDDGTIERLKEALQTMEDICFPTMAIPI